MKRIVLLIVLGVASAAHAQGMTSQVGSASGTLTIGNKLWLHEDNNTDLALPQNAVTSPLLYFNYASCTCARPNFPDAAHSPWYQGQFAEEIDATPDLTTEQYPLQIWVGSQCDSFTNPTVIQQNCHQVTPTDGLPPTIAAIQPVTYIKPEISVYDLMTPEPANQGNPCMQRVLAASEYGIADVNPPDGTPDFSISVAINTDSQPPPVPTEFTGGGAQNGIHLSWSAPTGNVPDIAYYQVLCAGPDLAPALKSPAAPPRYVTAYNLCGAPNDFQPTMATIDQTGAMVDAGEPPDVPGLSTLDPSFICADEPVATATSIDVKGLQNGVPYSIVLLTIDLSGNPAGVAFPVTFTPQPVTDFWDDVHDRGKDVQGGFCLIAETYGDDNPLTQGLRAFRDDNLQQSVLGRWLTESYYERLAPLGEYVHGHIVLRVIVGILLLPLVAFALAWHVLTLPGTLALIALVMFRRRLLRSAKVRRRLLSFAAVATVLLFSPRLSHAQTPYWEDPMAKDQSADAAAAAADLPSQIDWHGGVKIGPYIPQIDAGLGLNPGPYQQMFGSKSSWVPMLDFERVVLKGEWGQLLAGGTIGYLSKSAHPFVEGSDPNDPDRPRSPNDTSTFHLIPFAITASYRFTTLDDDYGIPIVPYVRAGLSYYAWWQTTDGDLGVVTEMDGTRNKAEGASLGVQGTLGVAIRAERIDDSAAKAMQDSGLYHAGFFGELQAASVNGFGNSKKLSVGDTTGFAGVDFEF
ncbi:MAG TPA: MXAN_2562 family outer membrane beta-barrel protein [Kofleriaceae bacterium]|nr:MXAN_2562 family outer membrane beta-barrel protein [Kofleriaceae bacterium]